MAKIQSQMQTFGLHIPTLELVLENDISIFKNSTCGVQICIGQQMQICIGQRLDQWTG